MSFSSLLNGYALMCSTTPLTQTFLQIKFMNTKHETDVIDLGVLAPGEVQQKTLYAGEVGFLSGSIKV